VTRFNDAQLNIPIELLEQLERRNVLLFIGEGVNRGMPNERGLPLSATLAEELRRRCDYPAGDPLTLPHVAYFYERRFNRNPLISFLRERLWDHTLVPLHAHQLIVNLPVSVIVTTTYDDMLERAHQEAGVPYVAVVSNQDVPYTDRQKRMLIWLLGRLDRPESLVLNEPQQVAFLQDQRSLSDVLRAKLAEHTWLILGFDLSQTWFRTFYASVMHKLDFHGRRAYLCGESPSGYIIEWCRDHNVEILTPDVITFLRELSRVLAERKQIELPETEIEERYPEHPYKGLSAFTAADRRIFFGRERETQRLADLVRAQRLVVLYGASGTGKTSLVQAGLVPLLERGNPPYTVVTARALEDPAQAICDAVTEKVFSPERLPADALLKDFLTTATQMLHMPIVIVLDQFEEFFVQHSPELRRAFIAELADVLNARDVPLKVVISLREEWLAALGEVESAIPSLFDARFRLLPLDREAARAAIEKPVEPFGVRFEPALIDRLLDDLGGGTMMPPQVQLVCETLYNDLPREQREITLARYLKLDGAQGILGRFLKKELERVPTSQRALAQGILEELVSSQETKIAKTAAELGRALETDMEQLQPILHTLAGRLLHVIVGEDTEPLYELAHEYLISEIVLSPEVRARKEAEELLHQSTDNWQRHGTLMSTDHLQFVAPHVGKLTLGAEVWDLLLHSALATNHDVTFWTTHHSDPHRAAGEVLSFLMEADLKRKKVLVINIAEELGREGNERAVWYPPLVTGLTGNLASTEKAVQIRAREILVCTGLVPGLSWGDCLLIYLAGVRFLVPQYTTRVLRFGFGAALGGLLSGMTLVPLGFWLDFLYQLEDLTLVQSVARWLFILGPSAGLSSMLIGLGLGLGVVLGRGRSLFVETTSSMMSGLLGGALVMGYLYVFFPAFVPGMRADIAIPLFAFLTAFVAGLIVYCARRVKKLIKRSQVASQIIAGAALGAAIGAVGDIIVGEFPVLLITGTIFGTGTAAGLSLAEPRVHSASLELLGR
jgi:hypothetical protein